MSMRNLCSVAFNGKNKLNCFTVASVKFYSRKSNNDEGPYKIVTPKKAVKEIQSEVYRDPNFELLFQTKGFPFFLPGNVGPAWHDKYSTVQNQNRIIMKYIPKASSGSVKCQVQECPRVLRPTVYELFPHTSLEHLELSVVTLTLNSDVKMLRSNIELETERLAQTFVLAANSICEKLRNAGYWADFINPFSGRPYLQPPKPDGSLYATDEKFRCLDFQIISINECKIVTNEEDKRCQKKFIGSLFTNAPAKKTQLESIFIENDSEF